MKRIDDNIQQIVGSENLLEKGILIINFFYVPSIFSSSHEEKIKTFAEKNPLPFNFFQGYVRNKGQCQTSFDHPKYMISTLDLAERTNYTMNGGDYEIPHLPLSEVAYGHGTV